MALRSLKAEDAPLMLEWMHDDSVVRDLKADFLNKTIEDCQRFIEAATHSATDLHLAIADDQDEYLGTVSLKHIHNGTAEFGITIRKKAMGKGVSRSAMMEILRCGFEQLQLEMVYWCVDPVNERAVRFYDKNGFSRRETPDQAQGYSEEECRRYIWYQVSKKEFERFLST